MSVSASVSSVTSLVVSIVIAALQIYGLVYSVKQERIRCTCSAGITRTYIKWYLAATLVLSLIAIVMGGSFAPVIWILMLPLMILFIASVFKYRQQIKHNNCHCALTGSGKDVLLSLAVIELIGIASCLIALPIGVYLSR